MTDEEAIERLKQIKKDNDEIVEESKNLATGELTASLANDSIAIETVLNLIQKQKEEIEKKDRQLEEKTNRVKNIEKECQKYFDNMMDTILENNNKNLIIDLMAEELTTPINSKEWVIDYYKRKVEDN